MMIGMINYLKTLVEKEFLEKNQFSKRLTIKKFLMPEKGSQGYQFKLVK